MKMARQPDLGVPETLAELYEYGKKRFDELGNIYEE